MQKYIKLKGFLMLVALMLASVWCTASDRVVTDGYSYIIVKQNGTVEAPKGYAIQALWKTFTNRQVNHCKIIPTFAMISISKKNNTRTTN